MTERPRVLHQWPENASRAHHLTAVWLPNLYLLNGVTFEHDPEYGARFTIRNLKGTVQSASALLKRRSPCAE